MQLHLDVLGGLAGDMFVASVLDAFPEHAALVARHVALMSTCFPGTSPHCRVVAFSNGSFAGKRFLVPERCGSKTEAVAAGCQQVALLATAADAVAATGRVPWSRIRRELQSVLDGGVLIHALGIFGALVEAEAEVHGVPVDAVNFDEVGAWDSIADVVGAACLIDALDARSWSVSPVPLGSGRVRTAHEPMPMPATATALLLQGFATVEDGIAGERVTATGAAILKYLLPGGTSSMSAGREPQAGSRVLRRSGVGFGTPRLDGISNCVRLLAFDDQAAASALHVPSVHRELAVI